MNNKRMLPGYGDRIAQLRWRLGLNQEEFGTRLGVERSTVSTWENGHAEPQGRYLAGMARLCDVDVDWIRFGDQESEEHTSRRA